MEALNRNKEELWEDDFEGMADAIHAYIGDYLPEADHEDLSDNGRREIETGYRYIGEDYEFEFNLAGTVNSDPEVLDEGIRRIVFRTEDMDETYRETIREIERVTGSEVERRSIGGYEVDEIRLERP